MSSKVRPRGRGFRLSIHKFTGFIPPLSRQLIYPIIPTYMLEQGRSGSDFFQEALPSREEEERISQFLREGNPTRLNAFNDFLLLETARDEVIAYKQQPEAVQILFNQRYARQIVRIPLLEEQIN